jgi:hypothetical protein
MTPNQFFLREQPAQPAAIVVGILMVIVAAVLLVVR